MIIDYIRSRSFACNSSSSHSIVFLRPGEQQSDERYEPGAFGWDEFVLASDKAKADYLGHQIFLNLRATQPFLGPRYGEEGHDAKYEKYTRELADQVRKYVPNWECVDYGVDHQSVLCFPTDWEEHGVHPDFTEQLVQAFNHPRLVVLGGNDNGGMDHPLRTTALAAGVDNMPHETSGYVGRDDKTHWTMFNRDDGTKIRFRLTPDSTPPVRGLWPELVDVKITDYCQYGCTYCYQGSTPRGKHASLANVEMIAQMLGKRHVFEVAIGGGEPTTHPEFFAILKAFRSQGIIPNFTTRNAQFVNDNYDHLMELGVGGVALSFDKADEMARVMSSLPKKGYDEGLQHHAQIVVGAMPKEEFALMMKTADELQGQYNTVARFEITLLGWKSTHRGGTAQRHHYDWLKVLLDMGNNMPHRMCIDTALAQESREALIQMPGTPLTVTYEEGKFSCYIDAVAGSMSASSYEAGVAEIEPFESDGVFQEAWNRISGAEASV